MPVGMDLCLHCKGDGIADEESGKKEAILNGLFFKEGNGSG